MEKSEIFKKRLQEFVINIVKLMEKLPRSEPNKIFGNQILRSASSIGANYAEAICSYTNTDFVHRMNICRKEANETLYWLQLFLATNPTYEPAILPLCEESNQIVRIFMSSVKTAKRNKSI